MSAHEKRIEALHDTVHEVLQEEGLEPNEVNQTKLLISWAEDYESSPARNKLEAKMYDTIIEVLDATFYTKRVSPMYK